MIPKIIHYCWFGGGKKSSLNTKCIESWKKFCPDYEIIEWNESNLDFSLFPAYVNEAYKAKKWGFVPDYIRLWLVYTYGGIYLDTDVEIIKNFDDLLMGTGFLGFEDGVHINFGQGFGAEKGNKMLFELMRSYESMHFINEDGSLNLIPSPILNTDTLVRFGLKANDKMQNVLDARIYPSEYFCPIDSVKVLQITRKTYSIHWFDASWKKDDGEGDYLAEVEKERKKHSLNILVRRVIGRKAYSFLRRIKRSILKK